VTLAAVSLLAPYESMRVYTRGLALSALVRDGYVQRLHGFESRGWRSNPKVPNVWMNDRHPDHIAHRLREEGGWRIVQRVRGRPSLRALQAAADSFAGEPATLLFVSVFPRALRTPMRLGADPRWTLGTKAVRCRRFGPKAHRKIQGYEVELRLSRTTSSSGKHTLYAEAFVTRHETGEGKARAKLFLADMRHVARVVGDKAVQFIAELLDALFMWVYELEKEGIVPDALRLPLPQVGVAHAVDAVGEVYFDVTLPEPSGTRRVATRASGGFMPIERDEDVERLLACVADNHALLARPGVHARDEILGKPNANDDAG
jgi:hypothetical protein